VDRKTSRMLMSIALVVMLLLAAAVTLTGNL
jgi:hypothetical protein